MSYEELLAAMEQEEVSVPETENSPPAPTEEILEYENNVIPFLSHYNIQPGDLTVSKKLLYELYKRYTNEPVIALTFHRIVGKFIGQYANYSGTFYKINQDQFAITKHIFEHFKQHRVVKTKSRTYQNHFKSFLTTKNISKGSSWLQGFVLYEIYRDFCRDRHKRAKFSYRNFHDFLKENFKYKRLKGNRSLWFAVNEETTRYFPEEKLKEIIEARRRSKDRL